MKRDDTIGNLSFNFGGELGEITKTLDVIYRRAMHGLLAVKIFAQPSRTPGGPLRSTGPVKYEKHSSYMAGALTQHTEEAALAYSVYKIYLPYVSSCFHNKTQKWNTKYKQARMIFTQMPQGIVARRIIHSLYESLYRPTATSKYGVLNSGLAFLQLFHFGQRDGQNRFFTYVISDNTLKFSETGAPFFTDFMSKHAMHANCAKEVYYSGEFCVAQVGQSWKLYVDNNSGTYAPNKADLPCLEACFRQNFPDLDVQALDREDPKLADLKRKCPTNPPAQNPQENPMQAYQQYFNPNTLPANQPVQDLSSASSFPLQNPAQLYQLQSQQQPPPVQYPSTLPHQMFFSPPPATYPPSPQQYPPYQPNSPAQFNQTPQNHAPKFQFNSEYSHVLQNGNYPNNANFQNDMQPGNYQNNYNDQQALPPSVANRPAKLLQPNEMFPIDVGMIKIGFGWEIVHPYENSNSQTPVELDGTTFSLHSNGLIAASTDMTFYNNRQSTDGSIYNHGGNITSAYEGDLEQVSVDLTRISPDIVTVVFVLAVYEAEQRGMNFGFVRNPFIRVADSQTNVEICRFYFTQDGRLYHSVIMGKLVMQNQKWFFQAVGNGMGGIKSVANMFGANTM
eukprot:Phypoly_transcript_02950.p1 GENE.Phypoly_transcript_02950~~Phypoly_transcript_02950.p1  ORF type:complete len:702 (+),score=85.38 Phypoly_transcript_02950:252-2108(+)